MNYIVGQVDQIQNLPLKVGDKIRCGKKSFVVDLRDGKQKLRHTTFIHNSWITVYCDIDDVSRIDWVKV